VRRLVLIACLALGLPLLGQSVDAAVGIGTAAAGHLSGGAWPSFALTGMFNQHVGVAGEFAQRTSSPRNAYNALDYRPKMMDINLALRPTRKVWTPELQLGYGRLVTEPNTDEVACIQTPCAPPPAVWKNAAHLGVLAKTYLSHGVFLRLEFHQLIGKNIDHPSRFAISLGYTFGGK
jgi:hypothetical protein